MKLAENRRAPFTMGALARPKPSERPGPRRAAGRASGPQDTIAANLAARAASKPVGPIRHRDPPRRAGAKGNRASSSRPCCPRFHLCPHRAVHAAFEPLCLNGGDSARKRVVRPDWSRISLRRCGEPAGWNGPARSERSKVTPGFRRCEPTPPVRPQAGQWAHETANTTHSRDRSDDRRQWRQGRRHAPRKCRA